MPAALRPRFEHAPLRRLAGLRKRFSFDAADREIQALWAEFATLDGLPTIDGRVAYGVMCDANAERREMEYMCAAEVATFDDLGEKIARVILPTSEYAVFAHPEDARTIRATWDRIITEWAPVCGLNLSKAPDFERYGEEFDPSRPGGVEIWAPIKRR